MLNVGSEIGRLRKVLLHEPGGEVDRMVPAMMQELLFDDILFGDGARQEHGRFRRVLQLLGVELIEAADLLRDILEDDRARSWVIDVLLGDRRGALARRLADSPTPDLAAALVRGVRAEAPGKAIEIDRLYDVPPLPNWCFQRDPQIVLGDGVVFCAMGTSARHRESLLSRALFHFHPDLAGAPVLHDALTPDHEHHALFVDAQRPCLEGGDVLVLSREIVVVARSVRTNRTGVQRLARALSRREDGPRWMLVVDLPQRRAYMHLDTVFTPVDRNACLVYAPVVSPGGAEPAVVHEIDLREREQRAVLRDGLLPALAKRGLELEPIPCGGGDPVAQQREQWTDGANALAIAPGLIMLYDRNVATVEELLRHGFHIVGAEDLLLGREEIPIDGGTRACIVLPSHELSRARGGPHCLAHPLVRD